MVAVPLVSSPTRRWCHLPTYLPEPHPGSISFVQDLCRSRRCEVASVSCRLTKPSQFWPNLCSNEFGCKLVSHRAMNIFCSRKVAGPSMSLFTNSSFEKHLLFALTEEFQVCNCNVHGSSTHTVNKNGCSNFTASVNLLVTLSQSK